MTDTQEHISISHWGMFPVDQKLAHEWQEEHFKEGWMYALGLHQLNNHDGGGV